MYMYREHQADRRAHQLIKLEKPASYRTIMCLHFYFSMDGSILNMMPSRDGPLKFFLPDVNQKIKLNPRKPNVAADA